MGMKLILVQLPIESNYELFIILSDAGLNTQMRACEREQQIDKFRE